MGNRKENSVYHVAHFPFEFSDAPSFQFGKLGDNIGIFAILSQDTNLLDNRLLRRDQIWFVEKDRQGVSYLYALAEFIVRNDATYEKDYIQGRYGAIPFLGGMRQLLPEQVG